MYQSHVSLNQVNPGPYTQGDEMRRQRRWLSRVASASWLSKWWDAHMTGWMKGSVFINVDLKGLEDSRKLYDNLEKY